MIESVRITYYVWHNAPRECVSPLHDIAGSHTVSVDTSAEVTGGGGCVRIRPATGGQDAGLDGEDG